MSEPSWAYVSGPGSSVALRPETLVTQWSNSTASAIDSFLDEFKIIVTAAQPQLFVADPQAASMLAVRMVGSVEHYLRLVLAYAAAICPSAHEYSDSTMISLYA